MSDSIKCIRKLMDEQLFGVLATSRRGAPYTSLVAFRVSEDLRAVYLVTSRATRKFANLTEDERVSVLVDDTKNSSSDLVEAAAVTAVGSVRELHGGEREAALQTYLVRHPLLAEFSSAESCALLAVTVENYILVRRFQQVFEYRP